MPYKTMPYKGSKRKITKPASVTTGLVTVKVNSKKPAKMTYKKRRM